MWLNEQNPVFSNSFVVAAAYHIKGQLCAERFEKAFETMITRHEILRTHFKFQEKQLFQVVGKAEFSLDVVDFVNEVDQLTLMEKDWQPLIDNPFDLECGPLLRAKLYRRSISHHTLVLVMHHIITDQWSRRLFIQGLFEDYQAHACNEPTFESELLQYGDFSVWEQTERIEEVASSKEFWREEFRDWSCNYEEYLKLPIPLQRVRTLKVVERKLENDICHKVKAFAQAHQTTSFNVYLSALYMLIYLKTGEADLAICYPTVNRDSADTMRMLGYFGSLTPLRVVLTEENSPRLLIRSIKEKQSRLRPHQWLPFDEIVKNTDEPSGLTTFIFGLDEQQQSKIDHDNLELEEEEIRTGRPRHDFSFVVDEGTVPPMVRIEFVLEVLAEKQVEQWVSAYCYCLSLFLEQPDLPFEEHWNAGHNAVRKFLKEGVKTQFATLDN